MCPALVIRLGGAKLMSCLLSVHVRTCLEVVEEDADEWCGDRTRAVRDVHPNFPRSAPFASQQCGQAVGHRVEAEPLWSAPFLGESRRGPSSDGLCCTGYEGEWHADDATEEEIRYVCRATRLDWWPSFGER